MLLTVTTEEDAIYNVEVRINQLQCSFENDTRMSRARERSSSSPAPQVDDNEIVATLSNVLEFESGIAPSDQQLWHNNKLLQPR